MANPGFDLDPDPYSRPQDWRYEGRFHLGSLEHSEGLSLTLAH